MKLQAGYVLEVVYAARDQCEPVFECSGGDHQVMGSPICSYAASPDVLPNVSAAFSYGLVEVQDWNALYKSAQLDDSGIVQVTQGCLETPPCT